jgi:hypothetical protein
VKRRHPSLGNELTIFGLAADMQDERHGQLFGKLDVQVPQVACIVLAATRSPVA